jgi:arylsulfatase
MKSPEAMKSLIAALSLAHAAIAAPPNVLLVIADDMGFSDAGCYGGEIETPNIDRLAAEGVRFTRFYNQARCWTTRTSLMTGYHPKQVGADPDTGAAKYAKWSPVLPQILKPLGYRTYHSGKWHVLAAGCNSAHSAGFDRAYDFAQGYLYSTPKHHALDGKILPRPSLEDGYFMDIAIADRMLDFLKEHAAGHSEQPFFAYLSFCGPHYPLKAPQKHIAKYRGRYDAGWDALRKARHERQMKLGFPANMSLSEPEERVISPHSPQDADKQAAHTRRYGFDEIYRHTPWEKLSAKQKQEQPRKMEIHAAMVDLIDGQIGRVLDLLQEQGKLDDTLVMFLSDNGADCTQMLPDVQLPGDLVYEHDPKAPWGSEGTCLALGPAWASLSNAPFRRHKIWVHEGGISTPFVVRWPKGIPLKPGSFIHTTGIVTDMVPTLIDLAGGKTVPRSPEAPPYPGVSLKPALSGKNVVRDRPLFFEHVGNRALMKDDWKLVSAKIDGDKWELFNLAADRTETNNLAGRFPERVAAMAREWAEIHRAYRKQGGYPVAGR